MRTVEIPSPPHIKKEPRATVRPILFCKQAVYGEGNSEIVPPIRAYGFVREHESVSRAINLPKEVQGAVIADIDSESPAAKAGLREGDVIQEVNKQPVKNAKDLLAISKIVEA